MTTKKDTPPLTVIQTDHVTSLVSVLEAAARELRTALPLAEVVPDVYDPQRIHYLLQQLTDLVRVAHLTGQKKGATTPPYQGATTSVNRRGASRKRSTNPNSQSKQAADRKGKSKRDKGDPSPEYLFKLPTVLPAGKVLVHNQVKPTRRIGSRGFRFWLSTPEDRTLERCDCRWAPELGTHFRVRHTLHD